MGQCEVPSTPAPAVRLRGRYVVRSRKLLLLIFSAMIPGGQDKLEHEFSF